MDDYKNLRQFVHWVNAINQMPDDVSVLTMNLQEWLELTEEVLEVEAARKTLSDFISETRRAIGLNDSIPRHIQGQALMDWINTNAAQKSYLTRELFEAENLYRKLFPEPHTVVGEVEEFFERKAVKLH